MSYKTVHWALYEAPMLLTEKGKPDSTARQVLVALAEPAHDDGSNAHPSVLRLRWATGFDERTVSRALTRLKKAGLIVPDGVVKSGTKKWRLALDRQRGDAFELHQEEAEKARRVESERRQARRDKAAIAAVSGTQSPGQDQLSGTQNPGQPTDFEAQKRPCPGRRIRMSGTQNPDVRDAVPPEWLVEPLVEPGGTLPPDPLRRDDPQAARLNDQGDFASEAETNQTGPAGDPPPARASPAKCPHGRSTRRRKGKSGCPACRRELAARSKPP